MADERCVGKYAVEYATELPTIKVHSQAELDAAIASGAKDIQIDSPPEDAIVVDQAGVTFEAVNRSRMTAKASSRVVAHDFSRVEALDLSRVTSYDSSHVDAHDSSWVSAWGSSYVDAWDSSHVSAWNYSHVVARDSSHVSACDSSYVVAKDFSCVTAYGSSRVAAYEGLRIDLHQYSSVVAYNDSVVIQSSKFSAVIRIANLSCSDEWLDLMEIPVSEGKVVLYKRVSKDFRTQEGTKNETSWLPGTEVVHPAWDPDKAECGVGKFHACSLPMFCDEFRNQDGDRYVAVEIPVDDIHVWKNPPSFFHKAGFRKSKVLYECDREGKRIREKQPKICS